MSKTSLDRCAWVGDVPGEFGEKEVIRFMADSGVIIDRALVRNSIGDRPGQYAVVYFRSADDAARFRAQKTVTWPNGVVGEARPIVTMWFSCDLKRGTLACDSCTSQIL